MVDLYFDLADIHHPILNVFARQDHLVPPSASRALESKAGTTDYSEHEVDAGHIGIFTGRRYLGSTVNAVAAWLSQRD